ncbi:pilus assembly protein N-terminal domain-containing protein [Dongia soli]
MGFLPALLVWGLFLASQAKADSVLAVDLNGARSIGLNAAANDVIVGNPAVADVSLQAPDHLVVIGKQAGRTRVIAMDAAQKVLFNQIIVVVAGDEGMVTVTGPRKGNIVQNDYACATHCSAIPGGSGSGSGQPPAP